MRKAKAKSFLAAQTAPGVANLQNLLAGSRAAPRRKLRFLHFVARYGGGVEVGAGMRRV